MATKQTQKPDYLYREEVIRLWQRKQIPMQRAQELLDCSERHVYRLQDMLEQRGTLRYQSHPAWNRTPADLEEIVCRKIRENPVRKNQHIADLLAEDGFATNRATVRNIRIRNHLRQDQITRTAYERFERERVGELIMQDTSTHHWVAELPKLKLIANLDDHSRLIPFARFFWHDGTWQNMLAIRSVLERYGLFETFFVDRAGHFSGQDRLLMASSRITRGEDERVQIPRALAEAQVTLSKATAYHPESKGKIERWFGFAQGRLPHDLHASTLAAANTQLAAWVRWYNTKHINAETKQIPLVRFRQAMREGRSAFAPLKPRLPLDDIFAFRAERLVRKDNTFSYGGKTYHLQHVGGELMYKTCELRIRPTAIRVWYRGNYITSVPFQGPFDRPID
ncbi:MAG: hypothetical protein V1895_00495 [Parcubacteria group bacterium]